MSGATNAARGSRRPRVIWWAFFLLVIAVALLVWQPWRATSLLVAGPSPAPGVTTPEDRRLSAAEVSPTPVPTQSTPTPRPSPGSLVSATTTLPTPPSPTLPGSGAMFDPVTALDLFVTADQLAGTVPVAADGVVPAPAPSWGIPAGGRVTPPGCLVARTIVTREPGFVARTWLSQGFGYDQQAVLLADPAAARSAFATLVGTVDGCPEYAVLDSRGSGERWQGQAAIEGQGLYPSIVQEVTVEPGFGTRAGFRGHLLVGNAIVSWTALAPADGAAEALGPADALSAMIQDRALAAVRAAG